MSFRTVPDELVEYAESTLKHFRHLGYRVVIEQDRLEFPYTPTLACRREPTTLIVEVAAEVPMDKVDDWVAYGRSSGRDTRVAVCVPAGTAISSDSEGRLRAKGVGLYVVQGRMLQEVAPANDLAMNVELPRLATLPIRLRTLLGPAYEQFGRGEWRDGFRTACQAFETEARRYLKRGIRTRRLIYPSNLTAGAIDVMTIGRLANAYAQIQNQGSNEAMIEQALKTVNPDRIRAVHHGSSAVTERRLRENVGRYMWVVVQVLKKIPS